MTKVERGHSRIGLDWYRRPDVIAMTGEAQALVLRLTAYSGEAMSDGEVDAVIVHLQTSHLPRKKAASALAELVSRGWAEPREDGGLYLLRWAESNLPAAEVVEFVTKHRETSSAGGRGRSATAARDEKGRMLPAGSPAARLDSVQPPVQPEVQPPVQPEVQPEVQPPVQPEVQPESSPLPVTIPVSVGREGVPPSLPGQAGRPEAEGWKRLTPEVRAAWTRPPRRRFPITDDQLGRIADALQKYPDRIADWLREVPDASSPDAIAHVDARYAEAEGARTAVELADADARAEEARLAKADALRQKADRERVNAEAAVAKGLKLPAWSAITASSQGDE